MLPHGEQLLTVLGLDEHNRAQRPIRTVVVSLISGVRRVVDHGAGVVPHLELVDQCGGLLAGGSEVDLVAVAPILGEEVTAESQAHTADQHGHGAPQDLGHPWNLGDCQIFRY